MTITSKQLKHEYDNWGVKNRNHQDLRFGQYICNEYGCEHLLSYFIEHKRDAYETLLEGLTAG